MNEAFLSPFATFDSITLNDPNATRFIIDENGFQKDAVQPTVKKKKKKTRRKQRRSSIILEDYPTSRVLARLETCKQLWNNRWKRYWKKSIPSLNITLVRYRASYIFPQQSRRINGGTKMFSLLTRNRSRREKSRVLSLGRADGSSRI